MRFAVVILFVLIQDAFSASAETNSYPMLRKFLGQKGQPKDTSAEYETRGLFTFYKPTKRPTSANVIFLTVPSSSEESEPSSPPSSPSPSSPWDPSSPEEPSWPAWPPWPYWPIHHPEDQSTTTTTTSTTPKPTTEPHPPKEEYPHYFPFLPPILLPIPGWTGNPPPPYIPPSYQHHPESQWPSSPSSTPIPAEHLAAASAPGTPTAVVQDEEDGGEDEDEEDEETEPLWVPLGQNSNGPSQDNIISSFVGTRLEPKPIKKPRPFRKTTTTTQSPFIEQELTNKRKPPPTRKLRPFRKTTTASPIVDAELDNQLDTRKKPRPSRKPRPKPSKKPEIVETIDASNAVEVSSEEPQTTSTSSPPVVVSSVSPIRRRKPRPSRKPTQTTTKATTPIVELEATTEALNKPSSDLDEILEDGSGDSEVEQLSNKQPQPKPQLINADETDDSVQITLPQMMTDDMAEAKPEANNDELTSSELGPEKDLIVVQRKGKPMKIRRTEPPRVPPWQLFKLPRDIIWEKGPMPRSAIPKYVFYG